VTPHEVSTICVQKWKRVCATHGSGTILRVRVRRSSTKGEALLNEGEAKLNGLALACHAVGPWFDAWPGTCRVPSLS